MSDNIDSHEEAKPEVRVNFTVYFHAYDMPEANDRISQIRHTIEEALKDEDNDLTTFTYGETRLEFADQFGNRIRPEDVFHGSI